MRLKIKIEDLEKMTKRELYQIAREINLKGRGRMRKAELLEALKRELLLAEKSAVEEPITSNIVQLEPVEERKTEPEELPLPTYEEEFITLIPVNPELSLTVWNVKGDKGILRVYVEGAPALEVPVEIGWKRYYVKIRAPFKELTAELIVNGRVLRSNPVVAPSDEIFIEVPGEFREELLSSVPSPGFEGRFGYGGNNG